MGSDIPARLHTGFLTGLDFLPCPDVTFSYHDKAFQASIEEPHNSFMVCMLLPALKQHSATTVDEQGPSCTLQLGIMAAHRLRIR
jgi:hypothetical protein